MKYYVLIQGPLLSLSIEKFDSLEKAYSFFLEDITNRKILREIQISLTERYV